MVRFKAAPVLVNIAAAGSTRGRLAAIIFIFLGVLSVAQIPPEGIFFFLKQLKKSEHPLRTEANGL